MNLKYLKKVGHYESECFTPEECSMLQELMFFIDTTLSDWGSTEIRIAAKELLEIKPTNDDEYTKRVTVKSTNLGKCLSEEFHMPENIGIEITKNITIDGVYIHVCIANTKVVLFSANLKYVNDDTAHLIVDCFTMGNWIPQLMTAITRAIIVLDISSDINEKSPPWNFKMTSNK